MPINTDELASEVLSQLKLLLGPRVFTPLLNEIELKYLGGEMSAKECLVNRPDLFERAMLGVLGKSSKVILGRVCKIVEEKLELDSSLAYSKAGDLQKYVALVTVSSGPKDASLSFRDDR